MSWILSLIGITGALFVSFKRIEGMYLWSFGNTGWIIYCWWAGWYGQIPQWVAYLIITIIGIFQWRKK